MILSWDEVVELNLKLRSEMEAVLAEAAASSAASRDLEDAALYAFRIESRITPLVFPYRILSAPQAARQRPAATLLAGIHCLHLAAHTIDDIVDADIIRDGSPTLRIQFGESIANLCGVLLIYRGLRLLCQGLTGFAAVRQVRARIIGEFNEAALRVIDGTFCELSSRNSIVSVDKWIRLAEQSVGSMITGMWRIAAHIVGANWETELEEVCAAIGIILRLFDDFYDATGKRTDFRLGAPNIFGAVVKPDLGTQYNNNTESPGGLALGIFDELSRQQIRELVHARYIGGAACLGSVMDKSLAKELGACLCFYYQIVEEVLAHDV